MKDLRADLNRHPIERIDGNADEKVIMEILNKYGITKKNDSVSVEIWGTGKPLREFLWSEEMADACVFIMENIDFDKMNLDKKQFRNTHINIGTGKEISIKELAEIVRETIGFKGILTFNTEKPDGTMRKLTDPSKLHGLGWHHQIGIEEGIYRLYNWYVNKH